MMGGVGAVVLAAGSASRMGRPKQTLKFQGQSLIRRAALAAVGGGCSPVIVVTGAYAEASSRELDGLKVRIAYNSQWATGIASSIRTGLGTLLAEDANAAAVVILLCDQPHVTADIVSQLSEAYRATRSHIVASGYGGSFGVPALFARPFFDALSELEGGAGAKQLIEQYSAEVHVLPFRDGEVDLDTSDDFSRLV